MLATPDPKTCRDPIDLWIDDGLRKIHHERAKLSRLEAALREYRQGRAGQNEPYALAPAIPDAP